MQEYSGIDWQRLQRMEARLRNDVLREAAATAGRLLVAREAARSKPWQVGQTDARLDVEDDFEPIAGASRRSLHISIAPNLAVSTLIGRNCCQH